MATVKPTAEQILAASLLLASVRAFGKNDEVSCISESPADSFGCGLKSIKRLTNVAGGYFGYECEGEVVSGPDNKGNYVVNSDGGDDFLVPWFCLELIRKGDPNKIRIGGNDVVIATGGKKAQVGCTTVTLEEVEQVRNAMLAKAAAKPAAKKAAAKKR